MRSDGEEVKGIYKTVTKKNQKSMAVEQASRTVCGNWCGGGGHRSRKALMPWSKEAGWHLHVGANC